MNCSIIIPTYNGANKISALLATLKGQTAPFFELIIVVDGSVDNTVEKLKNTDIRPLKVIEQQNSGRASSRNAGASIATGDLLLFLDDDMRAEAFLLEHHLKHHEQCNGSIFTGATIDDPLLAKNDFQQYKCWLSRQWGAALKSCEGQPLPFSNLHLTAANMSLNKSLFMQLGGFDENLRDCEDYDFAVRAYHSSIPIYYSEKAFGWHDDFPTVQSFIRRQLEYLHYNRLLYSKQPALYAHLKASRLKRPGMLKSLFFRLFKHAWWPLAIANGRFLFLPKTIRYRLYSWIVTAHSTYKFE